MTGYQKKGLKPGSVKKRTHTTWKTSRGRPTSLAVGTRMCIYLLSNSSYKKSTTTTTKIDNNHINFKNSRRCRVVKKGQGILKKERQQPACQPLLTLKGEDVIPGWLSLWEKIKQILLTLNYLFEILFQNIFKYKIEIHLPGIQK